MWNDVANISACDGAGRGLDCGLHVAVGMKACCHANLCMYVCMLVNVGHGLLVWCVELSGAVWFI